MLKMLCVQVLNNIRSWIIAILHFLNTWNSREISHTTIYQARERSLSPHNRTMEEKLDRPTSLMSRRIRRSPLLSTRLFLWFHSPQPRRKSQHFYLRNTCLSLDKRRIIHPCTFRILQQRNYTPDGDRSRTAYYCLPSHRAAVSRSWNW